MNLAFHIIFTTGTARDLLPLTRSLLRCQSGTFHLVGNALDGDEEEVLVDFAREHDRVSFSRFPTRKMAEHGDVLNALFESSGGDGSEEGEYFAFMDSDIFATGDFIHELESLGKQDAVFSGVPVWATESDQIAPSTARKMGGPQNRVASGACLGTSYFAVYRRDAVIDCKQRFGVAFEKVKDSSLLPESAKQLLRGVGAWCDGYETAKCMNLLMHATGRSLQVVDLPSIRHVGGLSLLAKKTRGNKVYLNDPDRGGAAPTNPDKPWLLRKRLTCQYLSDSIRHASSASGAELRDLAIEDPAVRSRVIETGKQLQSLVRASTSIR